MYTYVYKLLVYFLSTHSLMDTRLLPSIGYCEYAAVTLAVQISFWDSAFDSLGYITWSRITIPHGSLFLISWGTVTWFSIAAEPWMWMPMSPYPYHFLLFFCLFFSFSFSFFLFFFFDSSHPTGCTTLLLSGSTTDSPWRFFFYFYQALAP